MWNNFTCSSNFSFSLVKYHCCGPGRRRRCVRRTKHAVPGAMSCPHIAAKVSYFVLIVFAAHFTSNFKKSYSLLQIVYEMK